MLDEEDKVQDRHQPPASDQGASVPKSVEKEVKMAAASKEMTPEQKEKEAAGSSSSSIGSMVYSLVKKVALVGGIYLVGYMGWSVAWLIGWFFTSV